MRTGEGTSPAARSMPEQSRTHVPKRLDYVLGGPFFACESRARHSCEHGRQCQSGSVPVTGYPRSMVSPRSAASDHGGVTREAIDQRDTRALTAFRPLSFPHRQTATLSLIPSFGACDRKRVV